MNLRWYFHSISVSRLFLAFPLSFYVTSFSVNKKAFFHCFWCGYLCARALSLQAILYRVGHILGRHTPLLLLSWSLPPHPREKWREGVGRRGEGRESKRKRTYSGWKEGIAFFFLTLFSKKKLRPYFCSAGCLLPCGLFSSCGEQGPLSGRGARASHCSGFSCCGAQALGCAGFGSCGHGLRVLSCSMAGGTFLDQQLNTHLLHWQADSLLLSHQGSP